jgi:2-iminobutanoate/2-iminopropanoate deaminase
MGGMRRVNADSVVRLPAFCHAVEAGGFLFVSGTLGTKEGVLQLVDGGIAAETRQLLRNFSTILESCGASLSDIVKVQVYLADLQSFQEMNAVYMEIMGEEPPARITVGRADLVLGAAVEMDCVAYRG